MHFKPTVKVIHNLPGRLRVKLSPAPKNSLDMEKTVKGHPGIIQVKVSEITKSVLLRFNPEEISQEELIIRVAVYISLENQLQPVRIYSDVVVSEMANSAFLSGGLIITTLTARLFRRSTKLHLLLDWIAGIGTAYSIFDHAYGEVKKRGNFDPEVLSIVYLLTAFLQGNFIPATLFTWIATFGRHLMVMPSKNVEIKPKPLSAENHRTQNYEVLITPINQLPGDRKFLKLLPTLIMHASMGDTSKALQGTLLEQIQKVSDKHGEVLEGFGEFKSGIPIRIQYNKRSKK